MEIQSYFNINLNYKKLESSIKGEVELGFNELWILNSLVESHGTAAGLDGLKIQLGVSYALIHKYIKNLEDRSLVSKIKSEEDRRKWIIQMNDSELSNSMEVLEKVEEKISSINI